MEKNELLIFFVGTLITSAVGFILVLATDFGGFWAGYYGYVGFYVLLEAGSAFALIFLPEIIIFGFCIYLSTRVLMNLEATPSEIQVKYGFYLSLVVVIMNIIGAIVFIIELADTNWWFDAGFYGGLIGALLTMLFLKFYLNNIKKSS
ncbi:MAG: hypothetical protein ACFFD2_26030 [Promethearchaeota archaeon]